MSNPWVDLDGLRYRPDHLLDDLWLVFIANRSPRPRPYQWYRDIRTYRGAA